MKLVKEDAMIDGVAETDDQFQVEVQRDIAGGFKLYVSVNGKTIVRIGRIVSIEYGRFPKQGAMPEPDHMSYEQGVRDGMSRAASRPGDGDMGG